MKEIIDFIITWVDESDPKWLKEFEYYSSKGGQYIDKSATRYRNWDTLRYWFRGVEKYSPWVNKIYFVTYGHIPQWLNTNNPKLVIVKHEDFIPSQYLPTFSSNVIEFFFHKIVGLSDHFVYFNDDMFLLDKVSPERFFRNGLPCDKAVMSTLENHDGMFGCSVYLANYLVNKNIDKGTAIKNNLLKWYNPLAPRTTLHNLLFYKKHRFPGFYSHHLPQGYQKKIYTVVWKNCEEHIKRTSKHRFRSYGDVAPWLLRFWQLASGDFTSYDVSKDGQCFYIEDDQICKIVNCICRQRKKMICLNDTDNICHFDDDKRAILEAFETILPEKCSYEI